MENKRSIAVHNLAWTSLLALAFIVLKLCHVIEWSWVWVLSPLWIDAIATFVVLVVVVLLFKRLGG